VKPGKGELFLMYFSHLIFQDMKWAEDKDTAQCQQCNQPFSLARRKVVAVLTGTSVILSPMLCFNVVVVVDNFLRGFIVT